MYINTDLGYNRATDLDTALSDSWPQVAVQDTQIGMPLNANMVTGGDPDPGHL